MLRAALLPLNEAAGGAPRWRRRTSPSRRSRAARGIHTPRRRCCSSRGVVFHEGWKAVLEGPIRRATPAATRVRRRATLRRGALARSSRRRRPARQAIIGPARPSLDLGDEVYPTACETTTRRHRYHRRCATGQHVLRYYAVGQRRHSASGTLSEPSENSDVAAVDFTSRRRRELLAITSADSAKLWMGALIYAVGEERRRPDADVVAISTSRRRVGRLVVLGAGRHDGVRHKKAPRLARTPAVAQARWQRRRRVAQALHSAKIGTSRDERRERRKRQPWQQRRLHLKHQSSRDDGELTPRRRRRDSSANAKPPSSRRRSSRPRRSRATVGEGSRRDYCPRRWFARSARTISR